MKEGRKKRKGGNRVRRPCAHCHAGSTTEHGHHVLVQHSRESFDDPRNPDTRQVRPSFSFFLFFSTDRAPPSFFLSFFLSLDPSAKEESFRWGVKWLAREEGDLEELYYPSDSLWFNCLLYIFEMDF